MIFRKGEIRTPHFAHKRKEFDHKGESILHYNTKLLLFEYIKTFISNNDPLYLQFECGCSQIHGINIIEDVDNVFMEKQVNDIYRPDIALYLRDEIKMVIEVVVTHELEPEASAFLKKSDIPYIKVLASPDLYTEILKRYFACNSGILLLSENIKLFGISLLDHCNNNIAVTYYPELKNIFPCFGYKAKTDTGDEERIEYDYRDEYYFEEDFRDKIDDGDLPCDSCIYFHSKVSNNIITCKNPLAKKNMFSKWDDYLTPTIFKFDKYFKSKKKHREEGSYNEIIKKIKTHGKSMEFFEYGIFPCCLSDHGGTYMKVWKNNEWVEPDEIEVMMKEVRFDFGKHKGKNLEYVYKNDKRYLYWILRVRPTGMYFEEIIRALDKMKAKGVL